MSLKTVKNKIKSVDKTRQVTKAMEAVSAVKMRKSQKTALDARPYALGALKILEKVSGSSLAAHHPLTASRQGGNTGIIFVSSDRGLAGSLNASLFKKFEKFLREQNIRKENIKAITIGRRGTEYAQKRNYEVIAHYAGWGDFVEYEQVGEIIEQAKNLFLKSHINSCWIIYTNFISTLRQEVYVRKILPLSYESIKETVHGILPVSGKFSEKEAGGEEKISAYTVEPDSDSVSALLFEELLKIEVYHCILESNASEHSARMIAMKNASDNARDILKNLRLSYNKERQASITKELNEIVGGVEALVN